MKLKSIIPIDERAVLYEAELEAEETGRSVDEGLLFWCVTGMNYIKKTSKSPDAIVRGQDRRSSELSRQEPEGKLFQIDLSAKPSPDLDFTGLRREKRSNRRINSSGIVTVASLDPDGISLQRPLKNLSIDGCGLICLPKDKDDIESLFGTVVQVEIVVSGKPIGLLKARIVGNFVENHNTLNTAFKNIKTIQKNSKSPELLKTFLGLKFLQSSDFYLENLESIIKGMTISRAG